MLTEKQSQILQLIIDRQAVDGVTPSYDEMKDALGLSSKSGIHRLITGLEERGYIKRLPNKARAIEVLRIPQKPKLPETKPATARAMLDLVLAHTGRDNLPASVTNALDEYYAEVRDASS